MSELTMFCKQCFTFFGYHFKKIGQGGPWRWVCLNTGPVPVLSHLLRDVDAPTPQGREAWAQGFVRKWFLITACARTKHWIFNWLDMTDGFSWTEIFRHHINSISSYLFSFCLIKLEIAALCTITRNPFYKESLPEPGGGLRADPPLEGTEGLRRGNPHCHTASPSFGAIPEECVVDYPVNLLIVIQNGLI